MTELDNLADEDWRDVAPEAGEVARFIWYVDAEECEIDATFRELTGLNDLQGRVPVVDVTKHIEPTDQPYVELAMRDAIENGEPYAVEFRLRRPDGRTIWLAGNGRIVELDGGERALVGVNYEITEQRKRQERANMVAHEMNHRVKNILTIVASIFRASARKTDSKDELVRAFEQRLQALSALNTVVINSGNTSAELRELVAAILRPANAALVEQNIDDVTVNGTAAQTIALVLNELMTNAMKYGGLAAEGKGVTLAIKSSDGVFRINWEENAGHAVAAPTKTSGFGMSVLTGMTAATFGGRPQLTWKPEGLRFSCEWPAEEMGTA